MKVNSILVIGDALVILALMILGLNFHQSDAGERLLPNLLPFLAAWALVAVLLGLWAAPTWRGLWRVLPAVALAAPLGAVLRAAWLGGVALPLFTLIIGATLALGLAVWRALHILFFQRGKP